MDVIQLVDGHWTPNGEGLVVSDVAGQFHLYGVGTAELMAYARYDQFLSSDYRPICNDGAGRILDEESGAEAHIRSNRCAAAVTSLPSFWRKGDNSLVCPAGVACSLCGAAIRSSRILGAKHFLRGIVVLVA